MLCPPAAALAILPLVLSEIASVWPALEQPSVIGAQIEQETCVTLTHPKCWNPRAELRTGREYGFGLGQATVTSRFNTWSDLRRQYGEELAGWTWEDRFDARYQVRAILLMDRELSARCAPLASSARDALACTFSSYNGGFGGFARDRLLCGNTAGCDRGRWFGNVELTSYRARVAAAGYGQSFFKINREYVRNVLDVRRARYLALDVGGGACFVGKHVSVERLTRFFSASRARSDDA